MQNDLKKKYLQEIINMMEDDNVILTDVEIRAELAEVPFLRSNGFREERPTGERHYHLTIFDKKVADKFHEDKVKSQ